MEHGTNGRLSDDRTAYVSHTFGAFLGKPAMQGRDHHGNPWRGLWSIVGNSAAKRRCVVMFTSCPRYKAAKRVINSGGTRGEGARTSTRRMVRREKGAGRTTARAPRSADFYFLS